MCETTETIMPQMTNDELQEFLSTGRHIMKLGTLAPDGWPNVVPVWYNYDGETFMVAGRGKAAWVANIKNDSRVFVCIDTSDAPYARVLIKATAEIDDPAWMPTSPDRAIRYLGQEAGQRYYEEKRHVPRTLITITPQEITTWTGGGWHHRYEV